MDRPAECSVDANRGSLRIADHSRG